MKPKIFGRVGFRFINEIERPDKKWIRKLLNENYSSCNLSDGLNKFYTMDIGIMRLCDDKKMAGPAVTVKVRSGDNFMLHKAFSIVKPGDVLVVETQGGFNYAVCGDIMVTCMVKLGVAGLVVDGTVRDIENLNELNLPIFARGTVCGAGDKDGPGEINFPIACGGVVVNPGDIVFGDDNGVVVIPKDDIEQVFKFADKKLANEKRRYEQINNGKYVKDGLDDFLREKGVIK